MTNHLEIIELAAGLTMVSHDAAAPNYEQRAGIKDGKRSSQVRSYAATQRRTSTKFCDL